MQRKKASDFDQRILELYDGYVHGRMSKRAFLDHASKYAVGGVSAAALLQACSRTMRLRSRWRRTIRPSRPSGRVSLARRQRHRPRLMARPAGVEGPLPAVLVVHENRGLNPYIEDVVRRLGKSGYLALGPDGLTSLGGYPATTRRARDAVAARSDEADADFFAGFEYLAATRTRPARSARSASATAAGCATRWRWPIPTRGLGAVLRAAADVGRRAGDRGAAAPALRRA